MRIEVLGQAINAFLAGMSTFTELAGDILENNGIRNISNTKWYPLEDWLGAVRELESRIGPIALNRVGRGIPDHAVFPPEIKTVAEGLRSINVAFHMNHRLNGQVMFDPATGVMLQGIGNYQFEANSGHSGSMICNNPYPCDFDLGIISRMAEKFLPPHHSRLLLSHAPGECRKQGDQKCTYFIKW